MSRYYYSYGQYLKERFPYKVYKIGLDAGFTCPNIDGKVAYGGCIYCNNESFSPNSRGVRKSLEEQLQEGIRFYRARYQAQKFIAYFQAYTNTYGPPGLLKRLYDKALACPDVIGLAIGTRPDCVPEEVLELIAQYASQTYLGIEYGLQTIHDKTLTFVNRGHCFAQFEDAVRRTRSRGLRICAHVILGLPEENRGMMLETAKAVARMGIDEIKIHHLYVARETPLERMHQRGLIKLLTLEEYTPLVCDFLERLPPEMVIQRLMGELAGDDVVAPRWGLSKGEILKAIEAEFERRGSYQGRFYCL